MCIQTAKESGINCENKVINYESSNFRHRFDCGAKSFDGNQFLNISLKSIRNNVYRKHNDY